MTDELDLDAIEARANAATPEPWTDPYQQQLNVEFIAAARSDVPALVAEVRRLRAENERLQGQIDGLLRLAGNLTRTVNLPGDPSSG